MSAPDSAGIFDPAAELERRLSAETIIHRDEPLARRTTLRVGGPADVYVEPANEADLSATVVFCHDRGLPFFLLGRGSNLLVKDGGFRGLIICLAAPYFSRVEFAGPEVGCGAGAKLKTVAVEAKRHNIGGLEFLEGIPGSVGGGLRMNAGAMGGAIFDLVRSVRLMDRTGKVRDCTPKELDVAYRGCATFKSHIAVGAVLQGSPEGRDLIEQRMAQYSRKRWQSQPAAPSAGCIFKNPLTIPAGKLVDELGLKGTRVGGAMVSLEHGNFIVNDHGATAKDVLQLIELIRARAREQRGIDLQTEVEIIGE